MSNVTIIGLTGKARSGKDTVARLIGDYMDDHTTNSMEFSDCYVYGFESFAGPIKSMVAMMLDFFGKGSVSDRSSLQPYIDGSLKEETIPEIGRSPRFLMQTLGTEWGREIVNPEIWIQSMVARLRGYEEATNHGYKGAIVVITDVRYDNEAAALKGLGATIVKVVRDDVPETVGVAGHGSEEGVEEHWIDRTIVNNGDLSDLRTKIEQALEGVLPIIPLWAADTPPWDPEGSDPDEEAA